MIFRRLILILAISLLSLKSYACKCPRIHVKRHLDKAYDFIIGKVIGEREELDTLCRTTYTYTVAIDFSYKDQLSGTQQIKGSKYGGSCGAYFTKGKYYFIIVLSCGDKFYSDMCCDNDLLSEANYQISFLNDHFKKKYVRDKPESFLLLALFSLLVLSFSGILVFNRYKHRSRRRKGFIQN